MNRRRFCRLLLGTAVTAVLPLPVEAAPFAPTIGVVPERLLECAPGFSDDLYAWYEVLGRELGAAAAYTKEVEVFTLFEAGKEQG